MNYNYSFSGSDCHTFISFMEPNYLRGWVQLDSVNTLSISVHEQRSQVRRLGHAGAVGFAGSIRTVAGSIIMTIINENPFNDLIKGAELQKNFSTRVSKTEAGAIKDLRLPYNYTSPGNNYEFRRTNNPVTSRYSIPNITTLPPTKIRMRFVSEYHSNNPKRAFESVNKKEAANTDREVERIMELHNVVFISENVVTSVNNMVTELVLQFIASDFIEFTKEKDEKERVAAIKIESEQEEVANEENQKAVAGMNQEANNNTSTAVSNPSSSGTSENGAVSTSPAPKEKNNAVRTLSSQDASPEATPTTTNEETPQEEIQASDPKPLTDGEKQYNEIVDERKTDNSTFRKRIILNNSNDIKKLADYINPDSPKYIKEKVLEIAFDSSLSESQKEINKVLFGNDKDKLTNLGAGFLAIENDKAALNSFFTSGEFSENAELQQKQFDSLDFLGKVMMSSKSISERLAFKTNDDNTPYLADLRTNTGYDFLKDSYTSQMRNNLNNAFSLDGDSEILSALKNHDNSYYGEYKNIQGIDVTETNKYLQTTNSFLDYSTIFKDIQSAKSFYEEMSKEYRQNHDHISGKP